MVFLKAELGLRSLLSVITYATNLVMFSMAAWQVRCMKHWVVYHTVQRTEFIRNSCYSGWRKLELSSTFCNRWSDLYCERFVRCALCYKARCFINLSRRFFGKIAGEVAWQITLYIRTSVVFATLRLVFTRA